MRGLYGVGPPVTPRPGIGGARDTLDPMPVPALRRVFPQAAAPPVMEVKLRAHPPRVRTRRVLAAALLGGGLLAVALILGQAWLLVRLSWPHRAPLGDPEFGINFSCDQAEYLLLEEPGGPDVPNGRPGRAEWCAETLDTLLRGLDAQFVRLSVEWDQVEPREGEFDFALVDALLAVSERNGTEVLLSLGMKAQRHPEYYLPDWLTERVAIQRDGDPSAVPLVRERALAMVAEVARHVAASPVIGAWQAENEPYHASPRAENWRLGREYVAEVVEALRAADPSARPVVINHAEVYVQDRRWKWTVEDADIAATSMYPQRIYEFAGFRFVRSILEIGPFAPNYAARGRAAHAAGDEYWLTELQAEPWAHPDNRLISPANPALDLTPGNFERNIEYARRSGADRVYLWGAEWWLFERDRKGDGSWWERARELLAGSGGGPVTGHR